MESAGQGRRRSARIEYNTLIQQATTEENRLFLRTPHLLKKDAGGTLKIFSTEAVKDLFWVGSGSRFYKRTRSGYLVFDKGAHWGEGPEEEEPDPEPRAITLYEHLGGIYRRLQTGEVSVEEDIRIGTSDGSGLVEGIGIPYPPEVHRRHYFLQAEEAEESEEEEEEDYSRADEEVENSNSGGDEEGEGEEEEESEEEYEEHEGTEADFEADKENKEYE